MCSVTKSCPTPCDSMDVACQAPLSVEFLGQEYWSELPFPPPGDLTGSINPYAVGIYILVYRDKAVS